MARASGTIHLADFKMVPPEGVALKSMTLKEIKRYPVLSMSWVIFDPIFLDLKGAIR